MLYAPPQTGHKGCIPEDVVTYGFWWKSEIVMSAKLDVLLHINIATVKAALMSNILERMRDIMTDSTTVMSTVYLHQAEQQTSQSNCFTKAKNSYSQWVLTEDRSRRLYWRRPLHWQDASHSCGHLWLYHLYTHNKVQPSITQCNHSSAVTINSDSNQLQAKTTKQTQNISLVHKTKTRVCIPGSCFLGAWKSRSFSILKFPGMDLPLTQQKRERCS